ncbi:MAG: hypothetical protein ACTSQ0_03025 [Candidatus Heimdallarchaeota archaeon]
MTIENSVNRNEHLGNNVVLSFQYEFKIFDESELYVLIKETDGTIVEQVQNVDYSIEDNGDSGGNVVFVVAPIFGDTVIIYRLLQILQETDYVENDPSLAETHEDVADKSIIIDQQLQDELDRSVKGPVTDPDTLNMELPIDTLRANKAVTFDINGATTVNNILSETNLTDLTDGGDTTLHDHDGIDENTAARHAQLHTVPSHTDTSATGAELNELTNGSDTALHDHLHTVPSHTDTSATGAELNELTNGSDTALHDHLHTA